MRWMLKMNYHVVLFHRQNGNLVSAASLQMEDYIAAIGEAQLRAQEAAGALVFACSGSGTDECDEIEIIFKTGDVPDTVPGLPEVESRGDPQPLAEPGPSAAY